ncbi:hypothetical protein B0H16DRAFT_1576202 [Mycena metata]|uniref:Uncharacterized protein n=1 Tax=Mycena metata TaxID=1033252 RepID=A0AAD7MXN5_9AGAR|nr:hypothetical protein B0H16DRAFT_1576202 [Mycena metata]
MNGSPPPRAALVAENICKLILSVVCAKHTRTSGSNSSGSGCDAPGKENGGRGAEGGRMTPAALQFRFTQKLLKTTQVSLLVIILACAASTATSLPLPGPGASLEVAVAGLLMMGIHIWMTTPSPTPPRPPSHSPRSRRSDGGRVFRGCDYSLFEPKNIRRLRPPAHGAGERGAGGRAGAGCGETHAPPRRPTPPHVYIPRPCITFLHTTPLRTIR